MPKHPFRLVSPVPPDRTGPASYTWELARALGRLEPVDLFCERAPSLPAPEGVRLRQISQLVKRTARRPLHVIANSSHHWRTWLALAHWGGDVLLHDAYLVNLYGALVQEGLTRHPSLESMIWEVEANGLPDAVRYRRPRRLDKQEALLYGITLVGDVVDRAERVLVHSQHARELILRVRPRRACDVSIVPHGIAAHPQASPPSGDPTVGTFGFVKHGRLFVEAAARVHARLPDVRFVFGGHIQGPRTEAQLRHLIASRGLQDCFLVPGGGESGDWLDETDYRDLLRKATVAVQLREYAYGELSGSTRRDCLPAGIPTIVNRFGAQAELPESVVVHVGARPSPDEVATAIIGLLTDRPRRTALRKAALRYSAQHSFARSAEAVLTALAS